MNIEDIKLQIQHRLTQKLGEMKRPEDRTIDQRPLETFSSGDTTDHFIKNLYSALPFKNHIKSFVISFALRNKDAIKKMPLLNILFRKIYHATVNFKTVNSLDAKRGILTVPIVDPKIKIKQTIERMPVIGPIAIWAWQLIKQRNSSHDLSAGKDILWGNRSYNHKDFIDQDFEKLPADIKVLQRISDGKMNVLFVGRIAPDMGHRHMIYTAFYYKLLFGENVRFIFAGGLDPNLQSHYDDMKRLSVSLGVDDIVTFTEQKSLEQLKSYYLGSHVFLIMSEHEGFCASVLEAQKFKVPIVALNRCAVKGTAGENALIDDNIDYETFASAIDTVYDMSDARRFMVDEGYKNFLIYKKEHLRKKLIK